jgi:hypothetical protein
MKIELIIKQLMIDDFPLKIIHVATFHKNAPRDHPNSIG